MRKINGRARHSTTEVNSQGVAAVDLAGAARQIKSVWCLSFCSLFMLCSFSVYAQQDAPNRDQLAAVMTVVNSLLLNDRTAPIATPPGNGQFIDLGETLAGSVAVDAQNAFFAQFDLQNSGVEFCFDLSVTGVASNTQLTVTVNETMLTAVPGNDNCYQLSQGQQRSTNFVIVEVPTPGLTATLSRLELQSVEQNFRGFSTLTRGEWNERAVRKVLKIFAFGGHARDSQIRAWADMGASTAITQMLNFDKHNLLLSPLADGETYRDSARTAVVPDNDLALLTNFSTFLGQADANTPIPLDQREQLGIDGFNFPDGFNRMITVRGLNPFRQRIGFWETNYHLAVNLDVGVTQRQVAKYYDVIMQAHEQGRPYYQVLGEAAKSAAIAFQYGHNFNQWNEATGECLCNDDFAREIHQLFFGIFGVDDPDHEEIAIPETAKMLTDMRVDYRPGGFPVEVDFQTDQHHVGDVFIFPNYEVPGAGRFAISGADAAAKIDALMPISIQHPESLRNLPVMIISVLADDNLSEAGRNQLRRIWADMGVNRTLLEFIQAYAISDLFHSPRQLKYFTSHERALYLANKHNFENIEAYFGGLDFNGGRLGLSIGRVIVPDAGGNFFRPINNVFGGQTGEEASDSALIFENNYNRFTNNEYNLRRSVFCDDCQLSREGSQSAWEKPWAQVLPRREDGQFYVADAARWIWQHVVGNFDNYTQLERAYLYALLATPQMAEPNREDYGGAALDFNLMMCVLADYENDPDRFSNPELDPPSDGSATILDIMATRRWDDYCQGFDNGGVFAEHEVAALNKVYTSAEIASDPDIQATLDLLGQVTLPLEIGPRVDADVDSLSVQQRHQRTLRLNTLRRLNLAMGFVFTTPFVFAEGQ